MSGLVMARDLYPDCPDAATAWQAAPALRWYRARPWHAPRLQQQWWRLTAAGRETEWRDVPEATDAA